MAKCPPPGVCLESLDREQWIKVCGQFLDHSYRQCWDYGVLLGRRRGARSEHVVIRSGGDVLGAADVRIKRLPLLGGIAYISGGPIHRRSDGNNLDRLTACVGELRREYVEKRSLVLRITCPARLAERGEDVAEAFRSLRFEPTSRAPAYRTILVDLSRSVDELRARLAQKWRNCLNKAQRSALRIRMGTDAAIFEEFQTLFDRFVIRKGFTTDLNAAFYRQLQGVLDGREALQVALAEHEGMVVAGSVSSMLGDTCVYLLGATSDAGLKHNAGYALQWHTMTCAKELGLSVYDLGGIDPLQNPGVYHFKQGIGGHEVTAPGPFELPPRSLAGPLALGAERGLQAIQRWRRRRSLGAAGGKGRAS